MDERLEFTENFNNKLNCDCFTTIRLYDPIRNAVGAKKHIYLKGIWKGDAVIIDVHRIRLSDISLTVSKIDSALPQEDLRKIIKRFYKDRQGINWETQPLDLLTLEYTKESKEPRLF